MAKRPENHNKDWNGGDDRQIREMVKRGDNTTDIAKQLGRTESALRNHASEKNISLRPKDKL